MNKVRHVSLDFWNTLATPSRNFTEMRNQYLCDTLRIPLPEVNMLYTLTKEYLNRLAETNGTAFSVNTNYKILLSGFPHLSRSEIVTIEEDINDMFITNPPTFNRHVVDNLINCKLPLSIGSNTNFISGKVISKILPPQLKFKFKIFSDLVGVSKPSRKFFSLITAKAKCPPEEILHIGDSETCDGAAGQFGIQTIIINNNHSSLQTLTSLL